MQNNAMKLIEELGRDIYQFGNFKLFAYSKQIDGNQIFTDYGIEDKMLGSGENLFRFDPNEIKSEMNSEDLMKALVEQLKLN